MLKKWQELCHAALLIFILLFLGTYGIADDGLPEYAPIKKYIGFAYEREFNCASPISCPARGIIVARGSFMSREAYWRIIDLDNLTLSVIKTNSPNMSEHAFKSVITSHKERLLTEPEIAKIILLANNAWNPPPPPQTPQGGITDVTCDVVLLDKHDLKHIIGFGWPAGDLIKVIDEMQP